MPTLKWGQCSQKPDVESAGVVTGHWSSHWTGNSSDWLTMRRQWRHADLSRIGIHQNVIDMNVTIICMWIWGQIY